MKTIEQKAIAYDEALKWMRRLYPTMAGIDKEDAEHYFPELRESEDERIRKECISIINAWDKTCRLQGDYCEVASSCIAWLEKQGEQSFAIRWHDVSLIPREMEELLVEWDSNDATWHDVAFYHADSKTFWDGGRRVEDVTRWCYIDDLLEKQSEPKPTDAEMKEILRTEYEKGRADAIAETQVAWSDEDEKEIAVLTAYIHSKDWSERHIDRALGIVDELVNKIKSIRPQTQWKPSEKQMEALDYYANSLCTYCDRQDDLRSLYNDLKKLKEE